MIKRLEVLTNVALLVVAVVAIPTLVRVWRTPAPQAPAQPPQIAVGSKLPLQNVDWAQHGSTLVLALQTTCHFCSESAPLYQRLAEAAPKAGVHLTAVLPRTTAESNVYLENLGVKIADVRQGAFRELKVRGTPTLILVDRNGTVQHVWVGKLDAAREQDLFHTISGN